MKIHKSAEDYLEAIYMLCLEKGYARSTDVASNLNCTKSSVSVAMKQLEENGYIRWGENKQLCLEEKGLAIAKRIYERHVTLAQVLMSLGVDPDTAYRDACKIEHDLSDESFRCIQAHMAKHGLQAPFPASSSRSQDN